MVNWKQPESADRLCAALVVAHPSLKLDYNAIATYFGQGATYDAIQNRFRKVHSFADQLRQEAIERGITDLPAAKARKSTTGSIASPAPRTPRMGRNGIQKPVSSSSRKRPASRTPANLITPTRSGAGSSKAGQSIMDAISLEDDMLDDERADMKPPLKAESRSAQISTMAGPTSDESDVEIIEMPPSPPAVTTGKVEEFYVSTSSFPSYPNFSVSNGNTSSTVKREREQSRILNSNVTTVNGTNTTSSTSSDFSNSRSNNDATLGISSIGGFAHSSSSAYEMDDPWSEVA
ncbi:uncharacterized protein AKAW2_20691A [Aspergillus luchuensis]|uniref:Uncharacterized protein n=2 Tax=Aspergillus kawachii TaxID=1069201 RepID=A0A7R7ZW67_ASPKA|nr:uncharacterized protein AKAW2_20691A [Aspergillus luchuensis]OJZ92472.1 hypothetical protein ASPFODRAFT_202261 [Aspergillus luchuensis CBS 106.47]BCR95751.1 hypothetical protein AKAW2_20691A [Aspergillus luchuensis]BCS08284.1 hypothetical protein ALUC_20654A [Aspergillus luchuensis]GAA83523.1 similar to An01g05860 [Aspergillus luchuensis IFO 4308]